MEEYWKTIETKLIAFNCLDTIKLGSSASTQSLIELEAHLGVELPESLKAFLSIHNGQDETGVGLVAGAQLLSTDGIRRCWNDWREIDEAEMNEDCADFMASEPEGTIKPMYTNRKWIPLTHDWGGNHIGLDYDPDINGVTGQVITFGRDEDTKRLLASSFEEFIQNFVASLDRAVWNGEYLDIPNV